MRDKFITAFCTLFFLAMGSLIINCAIDKDYMIGDHLKKACFEASSTEADEVADETEKEPETAKIECETVHFDCVMGTEPTTEEPASEEAEEEVTFSYYRVNGEELDPELYEFIRVTMSSMNISHFMPYVMCQIYQESRFDPYAEARNGQDKGLLQFRLKYWDWEDGDIFDPYAQLRVYLHRIKEKNDAGLNIYQIISDHYTGGVGYDSEYVEDVIQWLWTMEEFKDAYKG